MSEKRCIIITNCSGCPWFKADEAFCKRTHFENDGDSWFWKEVSDPNSLPEWCPIFDEKQFNKIKDAVSWIKDCPHIDQSCACRETAIELLESYLK